MFVSVPQSLMKLSILPSLILLASLKEACCFTNSNWIDYPSCAQPYLQIYAPTTCDQSDIYSTNNCLCNDQAFLTHVAKAVYTNCALDDLGNTAKTADFNCKGSGTPMPWTIQEFVNAGEGTTSTSTQSSSSRTTYSPTTFSPSPTTASAGSPTANILAPTTFVTSTSAKTSESSAASSTTAWPPSTASTSSSSGGYSTSDKIALGVGIGLGLPTLIVGILAWLKCCTS